MNIKDKIQIIKDANDLLHLSLDDLQSQYYKLIIHSLEPEELVSPEFNDFLYEMLLNYFLSDRNVYRDKVPYDMKEKFKYLEADVQKKIIFNVFIQDKYPNYGTDRDNKSVYFIIPELSKSSNMSYIGSTTAIPSKSHAIIIEKFIENILYFNKHGLLIDISQYIHAVINESMFQYQDQQYEKFLDFIIDNDMSKFFKNSFNIIDEYLSIVCSFSSEALRIQDKVESDPFLQKQFKKYSLLTANKHLSEDDRARIMKESFTKKIMNTTVDELVNTEDMSKLLDYLNAVQVVYKNNSSKVERTQKEILNRFLFNKSKINKKGFAHIDNFFINNPNYLRMAQEVIAERIANSSLRTYDSMQLLVHNQILVNKYDPDIKTRVHAFCTLFKLSDEYKFAYYMQSTLNESIELIDREQFKNGPVSLISSFIRAWESALYTNKINIEEDKEFIMAYSLIFQLLAKKRDWFKEYSQNSAMANIRTMINIIQTNPEFLAFCLWRVRNNFKENIIFIMDSRIDQSGYASLYNHPATLKNSRVVLSGPRHSIYEKIEHLIMIAILDNYLKPYKEFNFVRERLMEYMYFDPISLSTSDIKTFNIRNPFRALALNTFILLNSTPEFDYRKLFMENQKLEACNRLGFGSANSRDSDVDGDFISLIYRSWRASQNKHTTIDVINYVLNGCKEFNGDLITITANYLYEAIKKYLFTDVFTNYCMENGEILVKRAQENNTKIMDSLLQFIHELNIDYVLEQLKLIIDVDTDEYNEEKLIASIGSIETVLRLLEETSL